MNHQKGRMALAHSGISEICAIIGADSLRAIPEGIGLNSDYLIESETYGKGF